MAEINPSDLVFLDMCDECAAGELDIVSVMEGRAVPDEEAFKRRAESLVLRGFFERVSFGDSDSRHLGARSGCVYRRTEAGAVALGAIRRVMELEAELAALKSAAADAAQTGIRRNVDPAKVEFAKSFPR